MMPVLWKSNSSIVLPTAIKAALTTGKSPGSPSNDYRFGPEGISLLKLKSNGTCKSTTVEVPLSNFTAKITAEVSVDRGDTEERFFEVEVCQGSERQTVRISAQEFLNMDWVVRRFRSTATIYPGPYSQDHVRTAIQLNSCPARRSIFGHTGWHLCDTGWAFLTKSGGITVATSAEKSIWPLHDPTTNLTTPGFFELSITEELTAGGHSGQLGQLLPMDVDLPKELHLYDLPAPPTSTEIRAAIDASLRFLDVGPLEVTAPLFAAIWRAPLGENRTALHLFGHTGERKSSLAALALQHFGTRFHRERLPANWSSTANGLLEVLHIAKDIPLVIDEFKPTGTEQDRSRLTTKADQVLRALNNQGGKQRATANGGLQQTRAPRALLLSTGEQPLAVEESAKGRVLELEVSGLDVDKLASCQNEARSGLYRLVMSGYVAWLAGKYGTVMATLEGHISQCSKQLLGQVTGHAQLPTLIGNLMVGVQYFTEFCSDIGYLTPEQAMKLQSRIWTALIRAASTHTEEAKLTKPTDQFQEFIVSALATGVAHVRTREGAPPNIRDAWGWRGDQPQGKCIGWIDQQDLYLHPGAAYEVARKIAAARNESFTTTRTMLMKALRDEGWLESNYAKRGFTIRKNIEGKRLDLLHVKLDRFFTPTVADERMSLPESALQIIDVGTESWVIQWNRDHSSDEIALSYDKTTHYNSEELCNARQIKWHIQPGKTSIIYLNDVPYSFKMSCNDALWDVEYQELTQQQLRELSLDYHNLCEDV